MLKSAALLWRGKLSTPFPVSGWGCDAGQASHTPRRLVLTSSHWTNLNPSSSAMGAAIERRAVMPMVVADAGWGEISLRPTSAI